MSIVDGLPQGEPRDVLVAAVHDAALDGVVRHVISADPSVTLFGLPLREKEQREGLEQACRKLAKQAPTRAERVALVEQANQVRPRTVV